MGKQGGLQDGLWAFPKPLLVRRDRETAEIVEKGIALQEACGTGRAAEFLRGKMISMEVAVRVLLRQDERRNTGTRAQSGATAPPSLTMGSNHRFGSGDHGSRLAHPAAATPQPAARWASGSARL